MKTLSIDLETFSTVDLAKSGVYRYTESPDFEILLFGYSVDGGGVRVIDLARGEHMPDEIYSALLDESVIKWAHNAQFERVCLSRYLNQWLKPNSWRCTMVWSAYLGLPLTLEGAALVTGAEKQKLTEGKDLIRYFSMPCKPTKTNNQRTRNLPEHDPQRWERFKAYNARDVETEMAIQAKLASFPVPEDEWKNYILDQKINDRGILLDMTLVRQAIRCDEQSRSELTRVMQELTALDNPNSVAQMKSWLADHGLETDTLDKAAVKELLKTAPGNLGRVLELRQKLAKSSIKKYTAMENAVCSDSRARGLLQFYGANRTGRFAGRLIQVQNLPQNHLSDLEEARNLIRSGQFDGVYEHYIKDDTLTTIESAEAAGNADLREWANPKTRGSFITAVPEWEPGQLVNIELPERGVNAVFLVQKVTISLSEAGLWIYTIEYGGRLLGIADFLKALVSAQQKKKMNDTKLIHKFVYGTEAIAIKDALLTAGRNRPWLVESCASSAVMIGG